ncbi:MAG: glycosyltransferase [Candidatus Promineifilaceae bacterium]
MTKQLSILLLTPQLPYPAHQGTTLRNLHIIKGLAQHHQVTLLSFIENEVDEFGELTDLCHEIVTVPVPERSTGLRLWQMVSTRLPDMAHRLHSLAFNIALDMLLEENDFDVVQIEGIELAQAIDLVRIDGEKTQIVFDNHNAETELQRRAMETDLRNPRRWVAAAYSWVQVQRLARFERWACEQSDAVVAVSESDRGALRNLSVPAQKVTVIPNCIDTQPYQVYEGDVQPFDVVFMGKMDYRPNIDAMLWFVDAIWPAIRAQHPNATCAIVGQKPHARLDRVREVAGVTLTGWVESVQPYLHGAKVFIMPLRMGSGTRLKLIEAMAAGKAIVSTTIGAAGFPVTDKQELMIADAAPAFADAVNRILADPADSQTMSAAAQQFAVQYDWRVVTPAFEPIYYIGKQVLINR